ncbi:hypothetical protein HPP92_005026 [Vanilla planifolia]|uniref:Uncharacterized protein n=1 Tax=Vanilla planifolia TaxID=51239 RepID=A0A835VCT8_VANPL|nr:hypothetical protein HPP92_005026 [Vanilla planifolia]
MGLSLSIIQKLGFSSVQSLTADKAFDKYFSGSAVQDFTTFHLKFLELCNDINSIMLGKHYQPPPKEEIEKCYKDWLKKKDEGGDESTKACKKLVLDLLLEHVKEIKTPDAILLTGLVAPPAAMVLKKSSQNVSPLKKFHLELVPDIVFVPACTVAALFTAKALQYKMGGRTE